MPSAQPHGALIRWLHYNVAGDHFIAVYGSHHALVVGHDLAIYDAGRVETDQLTILASAWSEKRQELVTTGGDGTLRVSCLKSEYQMTSTGRRLMSRLLPRMTILSSFRWMRQLCLDDVEERAITACDSTLLVWCMRTGALLHTLKDLHQGTIQSLAYCEEARHVLTASHDGTAKLWRADAPAST